ncbi:MAG TPA: transketolase C-terminal domain-containing protein, partial [Pyrinomonadaceae bacterium]|nr:transketolase C-terminal domain-containing protein [Pyrinomonadaceae bacterium]
ALRYPRGNGVGVDISAVPKKLEIGKGEVLRAGRDVAIIAYGSMVYPSLEAAEKLAKDRIEATVVNARFVKPLDADVILKLASEHSVIITVEEAYLAGGFGSAVMELLEQNGMQDQVKVIRMGVADEIVPHGDPKSLLAKYGLNAEGIYSTAKRAVTSDTGEKRLRIVK